MNEYLHQMKQKERINQIQERMKDIQRKTYEMGNKPDNDNSCRDIKLNEEDIVSLVVIINQLSKVLVRFDSHYINDNQRQEHVFLRNLKNYVVSDGYVSEKQLDWFEDLQRKYNVK